MARSYKPSVRLCIQCNKTKKIQARDLCHGCYSKWERKEKPEQVLARERRNHHKNKWKHKERRRLYARRNRQNAYSTERKTLAKVEVIKTTNPCLDCGNRFPPECMDFDHIDSTTKIADISHLVVGRYSWEKIEAEIAKCEVICANCHRIRTRKRNDERRARIIMEAA